MLLSEDVELAPNLVKFVFVFVFVLDLDLCFFPNNIIGSSILNLISFFLG